MARNIGEEELRAFIAVELPEEAKAELSRIQREPKSDYHFVKWVGSSGMHLTLKFLGSVARGKIESIVRAMEEASSGIEAFSLETTHLGAFPNLRQPRVLWVGIAGDTSKLILH